jgi:hypothetical protein
VRGSSLLGRAVVLAVALLSLSPAGPTFAEPATPQQILIVMREDAAAGRDLLAKALETLRGRPEAIADLAVAMIGGLAGDPLETFAQSSAIADAAAIELRATPVVRAAVDAGYRLPDGAEGWDLGPSGGPGLSGFTPVGDADARAIGPGLRSLNVAGAGPLLSGGLLGVERVAVAVPDGDYEVLLLAAGTGDAAAGSPFGAAVTVNGRRHPLIAPAVEDWIGFGLLTRDPTAVASASREGAGGAVRLLATVADGVLAIDLDAAEGSPTYLAGIVLNPASAPTQFVLDPATAAYLADLAERVAAAEERIAAAIAALLAGVATAAGIEERVDLLALANQPIPIENALSVSPE